MRPKDKSRKRQNSVIQTPAFRFELEPIADALITAAFSGATPSERQTVSAILKHRFNTNAITAIGDIPFLLRCIRSAAVPRSERGSPSKEPRRPCITCSLCRKYGFLSSRELKGNMCTACANILYRTPNAEPTI
jgi:hypothetical protein